MTDEELIAQYIEKHGVTKIPTGQSGLGEWRWYPGNGEGGKIREVDENGNFFSRKAQHARFKKRSEAKFKAYHRGRLLRKTEDVK